MENKIRLNKYIASCTSISRREADKVIESGCVTVNSKKITELGVSVSEKDTVKINGELITPQKHEYFIFHKPTGYITTKSDEKSRKTIYDLLPPRFKNFNPAGRLDKDSSGLIILTNDGELLQKLTHPKLQVAKVYKVTVSGKLSDGDFYKLENGIEIEPNKIAYAQVEFLDFKEGATTLKVTLYQGYNRQIRKMIQYINHEVLALKRISHATLNITGLEKGQYRKIKILELRNLNTYLANKMTALKKKQKGKLK